MISSVIFLVRATFGINFCSQVYGVDLQGQNLPSILPTFSSSLSFLQFCTLLLSKPPLAGWRLPRKKRKIELINDFFLESAYSFAWKLMTSMYQRAYAHTLTLPFHADDFEARRSGGNWTNTAM